MAVAEVDNREKAVSVECGAVFFSKCRPFVAVKPDFIFVEAHRRIGAIIYGDAFELGVKALFKLAVVSVGGQM